MSDLVSKGIILLLFNFNISWQLSSKIRQNAFYAPFNALICLDPIFIAFKKISSIYIDEAMWRNGKISLKFDLIFFCRFKDL